MKKTLIVLLLLATGVALTGCVERRIYLRSEPAGADVYLDGEYVGQTREEDHPDGPMYVNFIYYGQREWVMRMEGFETESGTIDLSVPWYQIPPFDFFAEVLMPFNIVDEHEVEAKLKPARPANPEELAEAARRYRMNDGSPGK